MNKIPFIIAQVVIFLAIWVWLDIDVLWFPLFIAILYGSIWRVGNRNRKEAQTTYTAVVCRGCEGEGKLTCLACESVKKHGLTNFQGCPRCGGEGKIVCVNCKGTGMVLGD